MKRKWIASACATVLSLAMTVPVFAASPTTAAVMKTPVSVPTAVAAAKNYVLTPQEQAAVATTPEQAVALAAGVTGTVDAKLEPGVLFGSLPASPDVIALAKADILKDAALQKQLAKLGILGMIADAGMLSFSNGKRGTFTVTLDVKNLVPGEKVRVLAYEPGSIKPKVHNATWKDGKLSVRLPIPCNYSIIK